MRSRRRHCPTVMPVFARNTRSRLRRLAPTRCARTATDEVSPGSSCSAAASATARGSRGAGSRSGASGERDELVGQHADQPVVHRVGQSQRR